MRLALLLAAAVILIRGPTGKWAGDPLQPDLARRFLPPFLCIAATILLSKVLKLAQGLRHGLKSRV